MNGKKEHWIGIKMISLNQKEEQIPHEFKRIAKDFSEKGFITISLDNLLTGQEQAHFTG